MMRLTDLDPRWLLDDEGRRVGFYFISPTNPGFRQSCFVAPTERRAQFRTFWREAGLLDADEDSRDRHMARAMVQPCNPAAKWDIAGGIEAASFETLSVTPSLDGSAGGLWHGFITNGEIVGGI
jgi:hypothetical protein